MEKAKMTGTDLRRHERILVPGAREIRVAASGSGPPFEGVATVIGLGGMFVRTSAARSPGTLLQVVLTCSTVSIEVECAVRHVAPNGMGVEITSLTPENEQKLKTLLLQFKA